MPLSQPVANGGCSSASGSRPPPSLPKAFPATATKPPSLPRGPGSSVYKPRLAIGTAPLSRPTPYNGNSQMTPPTSKAGFPAPERPKTVTAAQAELEKIQGFIDCWNLDPFDTKRCIAKLAPERRRWLLETYDGSVSVPEFLSYASTKRSDGPEPGTLIRSILK